MSAPSIQEIEWAISQLLHEESSQKGYTLLSALYTCRDHMQNGGDTLQRSGYSAASAPEDVLGRYGDSDFLQEVAGKDPAAVWGIMNELMETLQAVNPRVYNGVMRKIRTL